MNQHILSLDISNSLFDALQQSNIVEYKNNFYIEQFLQDEDELVRVLFSKGRKGHANANDASKALDSAQAQAQASQVLADFFKLNRVAILRLALGHDNANNLPFVDASHKVGDKVRVNNSNNSIVYAGIVVNADNNKVLVAASYPTHAKKGLYDPKVFVAKLNNAKEVN
jgi:hypothetical protein